MPPFPISPLTTANIHHLLPQILHHRKALLRLYLLEKLLLIEVRLFKVGSVRGSCLVVFGIKVM